MPPADVATRLQVLDRLANAPDMVEVWREILKRSPAYCGGERDFLYAVKDPRFKLNDPYHIEPIKDYESQRIAVAKNIVTIAAWLVLEPPENFTPADHAERVEEAEEAAQRGEGDDKLMAMLRLPIYRRAAVSRRKGNWEHRVKIVAFSTKMEQMFGKQFWAVTANILSVALDSEIEKSSVSGIMKSL